MAEINSDIQDPSVGLPGVPPSLPPLPILSPGVDSSTSSIGASSAISSSSSTSLMLPPPNLDSNISSIDGSAALIGLGQSLNNSYMAASNSVLETWGKNIAEINEQAKRIQESFLVQYQTLVAMRGDPLTGVVSGALSPVSASAAAASSNPGAANISPVSLMSNIERLRDWEKNSRLSVSKSSSDNSFQTGAISALSMLSIGTALSVLSAQASLPTSISTHNLIPGLSPVVEASSLTSSVQTAAPTMVAGNDLLQINLMVSSLMYPATLIGVMRNLQKKQVNPNRAAAEEFAKIVITLAGNPQAMEKLVSGPHQTAFLIPLASYALGLLYAVEVGKANENFMGMEPEEFRDLLNGKIALNPQNPIQKLQGTLVEIIKHQLSLLPPAKRENALNSVLDYLSETHSVSGMTDLVEILKGVFGDSSVAIHQAA